MMIGVKSRIRNMYKDKFYSISDIEIKTGIMISAIKRDAAVRMDMYNMTQNVLKDFNIYKAHQKNIGEDGEYAAAKKQKRRKELRLMILKSAKLIESLGLTKFEIHNY